MAGSRVFLAYQSACQFWVHRDSDALRATNCVPGKADIPNKYMLEDAKRLIIGHRGNVHVAIASLQEKRAIIGASQHYRQVPYPYGSFCQATRHVFVACPELCFLQAATLLDLPALIMYGCELCGTYARTPSGEDTRYKRVPLTSAKQLRTYLDRSAGASGVKQALRASAYLVDGSASPRESALAAMMSLPPRLGGYGLPAPRMNYGIEVDALDSRNIGENLTLHGDMVWPDARLIVEYDGPQHGQLDNHSLDKQRDHLLLDAGYETIRFTDERIAKPQEVARLAATINKRARLRRKASSLENDPRKLELQHTLLHNCDLPWLQEEAC